MAVSVDLAEGIPPKNRREIGRRLALAAAATVYYRETPYSGPMLSSSQEELGKIRLSFRSARNLQPADGGKLKGFAIAGEDSRFVWADAQIEGDHVMVSHPLIPKPTAVRYGWADNPDCNLINGDGLPASPFRSDWLEGLGSGGGAVP
jgi:sialate O-acetylesterase